MSFSDPAAVARYTDNLIRQVPGLQALHRMTQVLLDEHVPRDGNVLVLGAGGGVELKAFARARPGWRLVGVDPQAEMLALAARTLGDDAGQVTLVEGYIDAAPATAFDGATCLLTLHFLAREARLETLRQLRQRLRPGAPLVIAHHSVPDDPALKRSALRRLLAFQAANGMDDQQIDSRAQAMAERLPTLPPEQEAALLEERDSAGPSCSTPR